MGIILFFLFSISNIAGPSFAATPNQPLKIRFLLTKFNTALFVAFFSTSAFMHGLLLLLLLFLLHVIVPQAIIPHEVARCGGSRRPTGRILAKTRG